MGRHQGLGLVAKSRDRPVGAGHGRSHRSEARAAGNSIWPHSWQPLCGWRRAPPSLTLHQGAFFSGNRWGGPSLGELDRCMARAGFPVIENTSPHQHLDFKVSELYVQND